MTHRIEQISRITKSLTEKEFSGPETMLVQGLVTSCEVYLFFHNKKASSDNELLLLVKSVSQRITNSLKPSDD